MDKYEDRKGINPTDPVDDKWASLVVKNSTVRKLCNDYSLTQLDWLYRCITGRDSNCNNKLKLARAVKGVFARRNLGKSVTELLDDIKSRKTVNLITFQKREVYDIIKQHGEYSASDGSLQFVNPLLLGQGVVDVDAFSLLTFITAFETAFPVHNYGCTDEYYMFEIRVPVDMINKDNSSNIQTCLPNIEKSMLVGVYEFYMNNKDCGLPNTRTEPYIKVVDIFSKDAMCTKDYAAAVEYGTYTGTDADFEL